MTRVRVLVLSGARPLRARRVAERVSSEVPDFEICGVVQHSLPELPLIQQRLATGDTNGVVSCGRVWAKAILVIRRVLVEIVNQLLWFAHGCPQGMRANTSFTVEDLAARCRLSGWPVLLAAHPSGEDVVEVVRRQRPDLVIVLGESLPSQGLRDIPSLGLTRVRIQDSSNHHTGSLQKGIELKLEHLDKGSDRACCLTSLTLPAQASDGLLGRTLKSDLIADDLLVEAAKSLGKGSQRQASKEINEWVGRTLSPYLDQCRLPTPEKVSLPRRYRSILKLCAQSLLCLPYVISRNWYRRLHGQYPVLILAHHLASDRPHPMGISTEDLWLRFRFLQRHYRIVSLSEADRLLCSGGVSEPTAVLTFDDGYGDNYVSLRAVAEETGAPIAVFLATRQVEQHREFDHDLAGGIRGFFPLTWDQVEEWSRGAVEFGSHTRTHFDCRSRERTRLQSEVMGSGMDIEMRLGQPCTLFAFPFGKHANMSPEAVEIAASAYSIFLSSFGGENLPRKGYRQQHLLRKSFYFDPWELELELQSVFDLVESSRKRLQRCLGSLRPKPAAVSLMHESLSTLLHACLLLLATLPPFRRLLNEISGDP